MAAAVELHPITPSDLPAVFGVARALPESWIAVSADHHRRGIGARLLEFAEDDLSRSGVSEVQVETLGESVDYEPYERTRAFYRSAGFRDFKSVMTDNPGMPESLTLRKRLSPRPSG